MTDRDPIYPGRIRQTEVPGQPGVYDTVMADNPNNVGTPLNKATLFSDEAALWLGLDPADDPTPSDGFMRGALMWANVDPRYITITPPVPTGNGVREGGVDGNGRAIVNNKISSASIVVRYNPDDTYTTLAPLSPVRQYIGIASNGKSNVLFGGGDYTAVVEKYDIDGIKTTLTPLSTARHGAVGGMDINNNAYFMGGRTSASNLSRAVEKYDVNGVKTTLTSLSRDVVSDQGARAVGDEAGGFLAFYLTVVERYDAAGVRSILDALSGNFCAVCKRSDGVIIAVSRPGAGTLNVYKYDVDGTRTEASVPVPAQSSSTVHAGVDHADNVMIVYRINSTPGDYGLYVLDINGVGQFFDLELTISQSIINAVNTGDGSLMMLFNSTPMIIRGAQQLHVMQGIKYKFREHTTEQTALTDTIQVNAPNRGYLRFGGEFTV